MTEPSDTNASPDPVLHLGVDREQISSLQRLLTDLADFFDTADQHIADAADHHFDIGDADGWLSVVLADHARLLSDAIALAESLSGQCGPQR